MSKADSVSIRRGAGKPRALRSVDARREAGRALRNRATRSSQAELSIPRKGRDVVAMLEAANRGRVPSLVPIRYGRMLHSPFAFLRGAAAIMTFDLARTPMSGIPVQACGDAHLMNFGGFATPERHLVFDVNDFGRDASRPLGVGPEATCRKRHGRWPASGLLEAAQCRCDHGRRRRLPRAHGALRAHARA